MKVLELTNPEDITKSQQEVRDWVLEQFGAEIVDGKPMTALIGGYLVAIWTQMIAHYGGSVEASAQLMSITSQLLRLGPALEAKVNGHTFH